MEHFGESEFTGKYRETGNSFQAEALAVTLPVDYLTALEVTTQAVAEEFGIESATRRDDLDLSSAWDRWGDDGGKLFMKAKWQEALAAARVGTRGISAAQIKTKAYNRIPDREGYSQAKFLVFDGNKLYGKSCTVIIVYRTDHAKQWGFTSIHNPFSFSYAPRLIHVVTNTEARLLAAVSSKAGASIAALPIGSADMWYSDAGMLIDLGNRCELR